MKQSEVFKKIIISFVGLIFVLSSGVFAKKKVKI